MEISADEILGVERAEKKRTGCKRKVHRLVQTDVRIRFRGR